MWSKGYKPRWSRSDLTRKEGSTPPRGPVVTGQTPLRVMQDGDEFYVGTAWVLQSGAEEPYTIDSARFSSSLEATQMLARMTGRGLEESILRGYIREMLVMLSR